MGTGRIRHGETDEMTERQKSALIVLGCLAAAAVIGIAFVRVWLVMAEQ